MDKEKMGKEMKRPESRETGKASVRRGRRSMFRRVNDWLHLWLGLASGVVVFVVCLTGCIWVFSEEITWLLEPGFRAEIRKAPVLPPSEVLEIAKKAFPGSEVSYAYYQQGTAVRVGVGHDHDAERYMLFLNPYTGAVQGTKTYKAGDTEFFEWVLKGHRYFWLSREIGRPLVNYGTLIFVVLLITGLIWWYPAKWTKTTRNKSFKIKWNAGWKRFNVDLHNVPGFYALLFLLALALTGMVYGLGWYSRGLYWVTSGGDPEPEWKKVTSDPAGEGTRYTYARALDLVWAKTLKENPSSEGFYYVFPDAADPKSTINIRIYPSAGQFYNAQRYTFDRHTLQRLEFYEVFDKSFAESTTGAKIRRMNYDIHIGSILGLPGKVLAFLASLIGASLPVTGFIVWWNRKGFGRRKAGHVGRRRTSRIKTVSKITCWLPLLLVSFLMVSVS